MVAGASCADGVIGEFVLVWSMSQALKVAGGSISKCRHEAWGNGSAGKQGRSNKRVVTKTSHKAPNK